MTDANSGKRLSVLIIAPPAATQGGVAVFTQTLKKNIKDCDVTLLDVGRGTGGVITGITRLLLALLRLVYFLSVKRLDVVHINPSFNMKSLLRDGLILLVLRALCFHSIMVWFHGWDTSVAARIERKMLLRRYLLWLLVGVKRIIVLAPEFRKTLMRMGVENNRIAIGTTLFDATEIMPHLADNDGRRSILFMSRYDARKGIYELVNGFTRIAADFPDVELVLAGGGQEYQRLKEHIDALPCKGRIKLCAYTTGREKILLLAGCELFALPTYYPEGMPIALLEAMAAGMPVLTAKAGGISHIISDPENGVVLDAVSVETVENGLRRLLNDRDYCRQIGQHNTVYAKAHFDAKTVTANIEKMYHEIAVTNAG